MKKQDLTSCNLPDSPGVYFFRDDTGAILYIGKGNYPSNYIEELLLSKDRTKSPPTFSPDGLYLSGVDYDARYAFPFTHRTVNIFDNNHLCQDR